MSAPGASREARLEAALDAAGIGVWHWNVRTGALETSPRWSALLGYAPAEIAPHWSAFEALAHPADLPNLMAAIEAHFAGEADDLSCEARLKHQNGRWVAALITGRVLTRDSQGRPLTASGALQDVSARVKAQQALERSEARLRRAAAAGRLATIDVRLGPQGARAAVSENFRELNGLAPDAEITFEAVMSRIHPEDRERVIADHRRLAREGGAFTAEFRVFAADGSERWLHTRGEAEAAAEGDMPSHISAVNLDITELKRAEAAARDSERRLRRLIESIDEGYCLCEMIVDESGAPIDYRFLEVNPLFEQMTGLANAVGRRAYEMIPNLEPHWREVYARVGLGGERLRFEQGSEAMGRWFDIFAAPSEPRGRFVIVFRDITERRRIESALHESERRFRALADDAPVMVWMTDPRGLCEYVSRSWSDFTGVATEDGLGAGWLDTVHPEDRAGVEAATTAAKAARTPFRLEYRVRRADGTYAWAIDSAKPRFDGAGRYLGHIGSVLDIDARKRTEAELLRANAMLDALFDNAPIGLGLWDRDLRFIRVNKQLAEINGLPPEAHLGKRPDELLPNIEGMDAILARWRQMLESGEPWLGVEVIGVTPASPNTQRSWREDFFPIRVDGKHDWLAAVVVETTEQKRAEERRQLLMAELNHRVKNTLAIVQSIAHQSLKHEPVSARARAAFEGRLKALAAAHALLTRESWSHAAIGEIAEAVRRACAIDTQRFVAEGPPVTLPPSQAVTLSMALHELATNALKYGALSNAGGRVRFSWTVEAHEPPMLEIVWIERGGPQTRAPTREGFGSRMLRRVLASDLGGDVALDYQAEGLVCTLRAPLPVDRPKPRIEDIRAQ